MFVTNYYFNFRPNGIIRSQNLTLNGQKREKLSSVIKALNIEKVSILFSEKLLLKSIPVKR